MRPLWADFAIAAVVFWMFVITFEYVASSWTLPAIAGATALALLLAARLWRRVR